MTLTYEQPIKTLRPKESDYFGYYLLNNIIIDNCRPVIPLEAR